MWCSECPNRHANSKEMRQIHNIRMEHFFTHDKSSLKGALMSWWPENVVCKWKAVTSKKSVPSSYNKFVSNRVGHYNDDARTVTMY